MSDDLTPEAVERLCHAAPFANNEAGIPQMVATLRALSARVVELEAELDQAVSFIELHRHNAEAALAALAAVDKERKRFPILGSRGATIDWQLVVDHGDQAHTNHGQTVARLAERGGLSWCELHAVLHNRRWQKMDSNEANIACRILEARYLAAMKGQTNDR
jgi:hypothetical protein